MFTYFSNIFINQEHEILVTVDMLVEDWQGNGGGAGGDGLDGCDGVVQDPAVSSSTFVLDCTCDRICFVSLLLMLCTFSPRPSTNLDSWNKPQLTAAVNLQESMHVMPNS